MPQFFYYTTYLFFCLLLSSCSSSSSDDNSASDVFSDSTGTHRLSAATQTFSDGTIDVYGYTYSVAGRLIAIDVLRNGIPASRLTYTFTADGLLDQRFFDVDMDGADDFVRQYIYENGRFEGWYGFAVGSLPDIVEQYFYTGNQTTGYEKRTLSEPTASPDLSQGIAISRASISYNEAGFVISNVIDNEPFGSTDIQIDFQNDESGLRTTNTITSTLEGTTSSTVFEYEESPCIVFPTGSWTQHFCVQVD